MSTSHNAFIVAQVSVEKQKNSLLSGHLIFNIIHFPSPPWQQSSSHTGRISTSVAGITSRADENNIKQQFSLSTIVSYQADYIVYTDGSASGGTRYGGAAVVATGGSPLQPDVVTIIKTKGLTFTSSYEEKRLPPTVLFCTDSKSFCEALISVIAYILERSPSPIPSVSFHLQHLSSGFLAILLFQATISQTKQPKKLPLSPQTQLFPSLYLALFKSSTKRFVTLHQYTNGLLLSTNMEGFLEM